jgi:hypothetical protein
MPFLVDESGQAILDGNRVPLVDGESSTSPHLVSVCAVNDAGSDIETFLLTVSSPVPAPVIVAMGNASATAGSTWMRQSAVTSPAMEPVVWSLSGEPVGMTIDSESGLISWPTPVLGSYSGITVQASNGSGADTETFDFSVLAAEPVTTTFKGKVSLSLKALLTKPLDLLTGESKVDRNATTRLDDGAGPQQANSYFSDRRSLAAGGSELLALTGALRNAYGEIIDFTAVKVLFLRADEGNGGDLLVGGASAGGFATMFEDVSDIIRIQPGGELLLVDADSGYGVTPGTADKLQVENEDEAAAASYDVVLIGVS